MQFNTLKIAAALTVILVLSFFSPVSARELPLEQIKLPEGFSIEVYVDRLPNARSLAQSEKGTLFVGTRKAGRVYAVVDSDGDGKPDKSYTIAEGLNMPSGIVYLDGALYVAEVSRIIRYDDIENHLEAPPEPVVVLDGLPTDEMHGWKYLALGPDGRLYFNIGAPCNICNRAEEDERYATICSVNTDGSDFQIVAQGVRNTVGFDWHPKTGEIWFTDNNRDMLGDDIPNCELNRATEKGQHFGFPFCHSGEHLDPEFGEGKDCADYVAPAQKINPHAAPLGMLFYTGDMFPEKYKNQILVAEHGSWNRSIPIGYRVSLVTLDADSKATAYEDFAAGWLQRAKAWGRPVAFLQLSDGSVLLSDDDNGVVYRISYRK